MSHCPSWGLSFSNLCSGAKDLSLLPMDCLEIGRGRKQGSFSHLTIVGEKKELWGCGFGTRHPAQFQVGVSESQAKKKKNSIREAD